MSKLPQQMSEGEARSIAVAFAQDHGQDLGKVTKFASSWFAAAMLHPDWAEHATEAALRSRLTKAFLVQSN